MAITKYSGKIPQDLKIVADLPKGWPGKASIEEGSDSYRIHVDRYYHVPEYAKPPHPITNREELLAKYFEHDRDYCEFLLAKDPASFLNEVEVRKGFVLF